MVLSVEPVYKGEDGIPRGHGRDYSNRFARPLFSGQLGFRDEHQLVDDISLARSREAEVNKERALSPGTTEKYTRSWDVRVPWMALSGESREPAKREDFHRPANQIGTGSTTGTLGLEVSRTTRRLPYGQRGCSRGGFESPRTKYGLPLVTSSLLREPRPRRVGDPR